jgi:hypothetical protein
MIHKILDQQESQKLAVAKEMEQLAKDDAELLESVNKTVRNMELFN